MKRIAVASHVSLVSGKEYDGIGNTMIRTLGSLTKDFYFVRHSMDGLLKSEVHTYQNSKIIKKIRLRVFRRWSAPRYVSELISTVMFFTFRNRIDVYIGIDPLNALAGIILKKLHRIEKAIFFTADYSESRFDNKIMDVIYHFIDRFAVKHADEVWSVSSRIVKIRSSMGLPDDKNIFVPNVPPVEYKTIQKDRNNYILVTTGIIDKQLDFVGIFKAIKVLEDEYPDISMIIVGNGPEEALVKRAAKKEGVAARVLFTGNLSQRETLQVIASAGIGLALYTGLWGFNKYGDSTKCREYFTYGLPVLSTDTHSTVSEIRHFNAGLIVDLSSDSYVKALREVYAHYNAYAKNSLILGQKYEGVHRKQLIRVLSP